MLLLEELIKSDYLIAWKKISQINFNSAMKFVRFCN